MEAQKFSSFEPLLALSHINITGILILCFFHFTEIICVNEIWKWFDYWTIPNFGQGNEWRNHQILTRICSFFVHFLHFTASLVETWTISLSWVIQSLFRSELTASSSLGTLGTPGTLDSVVVGLLNFSTIPDEEVKELLDDSPDAKHCVIFRNSWKRMSSY